MRSGPLWAAAVVGGGLVMLLGVWGTYSACFLPWHCPSQGYLRPVLETEEFHPQHCWIPEAF